MNFTENSRKLLWVHRNMTPWVGETSVDLVLTPQFYTMRREVLPVKYAYQAKKIAPSLFDGLLEAEHTYEYFVFKAEDAWIFIAYVPEQIISFLQKNNLSPEKIGKVFFAQQFASQIDRPILLDARDALVNIDGTVTVVPATVLKEQEFMDPALLQLPKKGVPLDMGSTSVLGKKQIWILSSVFLLFAVIWGIEGRRYSKDNGTLKQEIERLYSAHPNLQNSYTRESIADKYRKIDKTERHKRHIIGKVAGLIFKGVTLTEFEMDKKHFRAVFVPEESRVAKRLDALIKSAGFQKDPASNEKMIIVEGRI